MWESVVKLWAVISSELTCFKHHRPILQLDEANTVWRHSIYGCCLVMWSNNLLGVYNVETRASYIVPVCPSSVECQLWRQAFRCINLKRCAFPLICVQSNVVRNIVWTVGYIALDWLIYQTIRTRFYRKPIPCRSSARYCDCRSYLRVMSNVIGADCEYIPLNIVVFVHL